MASSLESQENLIKIIKEFSLQLQPHLNMANIDKIEDMLIHMEESDGGHEMKALVKFIRRKLTAKLSGYLDEEIEKHSQLSHIDADQQEKIVDVIFEKVQKSKQFLECRQNIDNSVTEAVNHLLENFQNEMFIAHAKEQRTEFDRNSLTVSDDSSLSFSLTQTAFLFVGQEQLLQHAQSIQKSKPTNERLENLRALSQMPVSDLLNADCWPLIRKGILDCLVNDEDEKLWLAGFKCCTRGLSFNSPPSKDLYMLLVDYVHQTVMRRFPNWKLSNGFDIQNPVHSRLVKVLRILNDFQQQITNYWIRFSQERFLEEIVDATLGFMVVQPNTEMLSPFHIVAMIDTEAYWLRAWTHACFSRLPLFRLLEKHKVLFQMVIAYIFNYSTRPREVSPHYDSKHRRSTSNGAEVLLTPTSPQPFHPSSRHILRYSDAAIHHYTLLSSMHILRYLLSYKQGTRFFPVRYKNELITVKQLLIELVRIISHPCATINKPSFQPTNPAFVATDVLKHLCLAASVRSVIFSDEFTTALLRPICWNPSSLIGNNGSSDSTAAEHYNNVLLLVAHIFSALAFDEEGKSHLLFGESTEVRSAGSGRPSSSNSASSPTAVYTLVKFVTSNMETEFLWRRVLGAYIYLCRQLYTSCQGLEIMKPYNLHKKLADAKIRSAAETRFAEMERSASVITLANDDVSGSDVSGLPLPRERTGSRGRLAISDSDNYTATGRGVSRERSGSSKPSLAAFWDETLKDNLLGFASTPGGIVMLHETGFFQECLTYMVQRYSSGVQMSKYEKYGYGSMVSQIAATLPGCEALAKSTTLILDVISNLWCKIETVPNEEQAATPHSWPTVTIDRPQHKPFIRLLNVLAPYPSIWFHLHSTRLPNRDSYSYHDQPRSLVELMDRIVFLNSEEKVSSLYNYEQSSAVGLRLLGNVCSSLNSFVLLENRFSVVDMLLLAQRECVLEDSKAFILDEAGVIRNRILVSVGALGGPSEKMLPPYQIKSVDDFINSRYELFGQLPFPSIYLIPSQPITSRLITDNLLSSLSRDAPGQNEEAAGEVREAFFLWLARGPNLFEESNLKILQNVALVLARTRNENFQIPLRSCTEGDNRRVSERTDNTWVVEMVVEYGTRLGLLEPSQTEEYVTGLMRLLNNFEQNASSNSATHLSDSFDWFVAVIFLMFGGDADTAAIFLNDFSGLTISLFLWPKRAVSYTGFTESFVECGLTPFFAHTCHYVQWILQEQLPVVYSALKMSGFSPSQLCDQWLCQLFLNYLDLPEIFFFITVCLAAGPDYVAYANVAIFDHLRLSIVEAHHDQEVLLRIKEEPIANNFSFCDRLGFMQCLERKYRKYLYADLATYFAN